MGKITRILTQEQETVLFAFSQDLFLRSHFYFTGGTVLSLYYLKHRLSEDLDFFSEEPPDFVKAADIITEWGKKHAFTPRLEQAAENVTMFFLRFKSGRQVKVDFAYYPHKRIERGKVINHVDVDSLLDIAVNKLLSVIQRREVKDFVDLYFLLKTFTIWDLIRGIEVKFSFETEAFLIAEDFMDVDEFVSMPRMIQPLTLKELKRFFKEQAIAIGKRVVE